MEVLKKGTKEYYEGIARFSDLATLWKGNPDDKELTREMIQSLEKLGIVVPKQ